MRNWVSMILAVFMTLGVATGGAMAAGSDESPTTARATSDPNWQDAMAAIDGKRFEAALAPLQTLAGSFPDNPDVMNYLGYANSQLGRYDEAKAQYAKALAIDPRHRGANEYLGELHLKLGDLPAAEARLAVLDSACLFGCAEYTALKKAIADYKSGGSYQGQKLN